MSWLRSAGTLAALLVVCSAPRAGEVSAEPAGGTGADSAAFCANYSTGSDVHTVCALSGPASHGSAVACHNYTVGSDTHVECAPVPAPRLSGPREKAARPVPSPASALRCYTYHIGSSVYTDCR